MTQGHSLPNDVIALDSFTRIAYGHYSGLRKHAWDYARRTVRQVSPPLRQSNVLPPHLIKHLSTRIPMFRSSLALLLAVGTALAQNGGCPTCGQNSPLSTTTAMPQTATAKIRIVLNAPATSTNNNAPTIQVQAAPSTSSNCATGNCNTQTVQFQAAPAAAPVLNSPPIFVSSSNKCASGSCNNNAPIVIAAPSGCSNRNCNNNAPIIVRAPTNGCFSGNCGVPQPIVIPSFNSGCSGNGCRYAPAPIAIPSPIIRNYAPIIRQAFPSYGFGCGVSGCAQNRFFNHFNNFNNNYGNFGVPDAITANGRYIRPKIKIPTRYDNGNPVFTINNGYGRK